jgi:hypothetical protein
MISRRALVGALVSLPALGTPGVAKLVCTDSPGFRRCTVGLVVQNESSRQRLPHWCWAACVETIFNYHGHKVDQAKIVEKAFGGDIDESAIGPQIVYAINRSWIDENDDSFNATATVLWDAQFSFGQPDAITQAAEELENDNPLILGALGHATVLTAMTYSGNGFATQLEQLIVRDPWPGNPNKRVLSLQEAQAAQFLAKISVE